MLSACRRAGLPGAPTHVLRTASALYSRGPGRRGHGGGGRHHLGGWHEAPLCVRRSCPRSPLAPTLAPHAPLQAEVHATTILSVRKGDSLFIIGDGQVSLGSQIIKPNARKVRKLKDGVMAGFAGATADAMTLFGRLEMKISEHPETMRACVEMAKAWRMDK